MSIVNGSETKLSHSTASKLGYVASGDASMDLFARFCKNGVPNRKCRVRAYFRKVTLKFAEPSGVKWYASPVSAKKAMFMVERAADILQRALKKIT